MENNKTETWWPSLYVRFTQEYINFHAILNKSCCLFMIPAPLMSADRCVCPERQATCTAATLGCVWQLFDVHNFTWHHATAYLSNIYTKNKYNYLKCNPLNHTPKWNRPNTKDPMSWKKLYVKAQGREKKTWNPIAQWACKFQFSLVPTDI